MAARAPHSRKQAPEREVFDAEGLIKYLRRIGPQPELADAIEEVYKERHRGFSEGPRGRARRRRSTPK